MRAFVMGMLALAGFAMAAEAAGKPRIEIHAVIDCAAADSVRPGNAAADGDCLARGALVAGAEVTGIGHVRFGRGQDMLVVAMNEASRRRFYDYLRAHAAWPVAVLVDGRVVARPVLSEPLQPASLEIPGLSGPQIDALVTRFRAPLQGGR
jgi:preprotein translocase subunit SecD